MQANVTWACCGAGSLSSDGAAANSYRLGGRGAVLSGLQARPVGAPAFKAHPAAQAALQTAKQPAAGSTEAAGTALYAVQWQAQMPAAAVAKGVQQSRPANLRWSNGVSCITRGGHSGQGSGRSGAAAVFGACQRSLRFVQEHMRGEERGPLLMS